MKTPNQKIETDEQFDFGLAKLLQSPEWKSISEIPEVTNQFNLFNLLEDAVCENAWSRIIHFLFDSSGGHGLGLEPLKHWVTDAIGGSFSDLIKTVKTAISETEWGMFKRRRLDTFAPSHTPFSYMEALGRLGSPLGRRNV